MDEMMPDHFQVELSAEMPLFVIGVVSELVDIPVWTLRRLDEMGIVCPERLNKKTRCYSQKQVKTLSYIHFLMEEKNVNLSGVKIILEMWDTDEEEKKGRTRK